MTDDVRDESPIGGDPQDGYADPTADAEPVEDLTGTGDTGEGDTTEGTAATDATPPDNSLGVPPGP